MKKLLILLAALSLVACSSNAPKEETVEPTPVVTETVVVEEVAVVEETPAVEEAVIEEPMVEEAPVIVEETPTMESTAYTILDGDSLFRIGLKYNMSWENIAKENNISNPDVITAGEVLTIPTK